ncbi:prepilin peptidase [Advenella kashmirensis W13003]|uniref:Replication restart protein PriB n=1 Tax=Advenella kashmirensis W13003 TaxID=1424334 RepID=V8QL31_9BURK|nr:primosomal replication protein N [Advenella kashmirensis]ETF00367.1 prepilin peptidase [Advenella kashmirensis W13003]
MNQLSLQARILEMGALRHTPAGLPVLDLILTHESEVIEAGLPRRVEMTIPAKAVGQWGQKMASLPLGAEMRVRGFLAPTRKNSSRLVLHIQQADFPGRSNTDTPPSPGILA